MWRKWWSTLQITGCSCFSCSGSNDHTTRFWCRNRPGDTARDKFSMGMQGSGPVSYKASFLKHWPLIRCWLVDKLIKDIELRLSLACLFAHAHLLVCASIILSSVFTLFIIKISVVACFQIRKKNRNCPICKDSITFNCCFLKDVLNKLIIRWQQACSANLVGYSNLSPYLVDF